MALIVMTVECEQFISLMHAFVNMLYIMVCSLFFYTHGDRDVLNMY